jgi:hypothetical protein
MTHDELLERLHIEQGCPVGDALLAVVELHKPTEAYFGDEIVCGACGNEDFEWTYPCPTIQAIEKELK